MYRKWLILCFAGINPHTGFRYDFYFREKTTSYILISFFSFTCTGIITTTWKWTCPLEGRSKRNLSLEHGTNVTHSLFFGDAGFILQPFLGRIARDGGAGYIYTFQNTRVREFVMILVRRIYISRAYAFYAQIEYPRIRSTRVSPSEVKLTH